MLVLYGPAHGKDAVADFSQLDITANRTITLGQNITVGNLVLNGVSEQEVASYYYPYADDDLDQQENGADEN